MVVNGLCPCGLSEAVPANVSKVLRAQRTGFLALPGRFLFKMLGPRSQDHCGIDPAGNGLKPPQERMTEEGVARSA